MAYKENDFYKKYIELDESISNERYMIFCNSNSKVSIITQYIILFRRYYVSTIYLILNKLSCAVYSVARSACECFASIFRLIETFEEEDDFRQTMSDEYKSNIKQLCQIYKNLVDGEYKGKMFERIKAMLLEINEIREQESDDELIKRCIGFRENIKDKVAKTFKCIPEYANDEEAYKNLYPKLCLFTHNNIDSIMERFFDKKNEVVVINELKEDKNIFSVMYMFISCTNYIVKWVKSVVNNEQST